MSSTTLLNRARAVLGPSVLGLGLAASLVPAGDLSAGQIITGFHSPTHTNGLFYSVGTGSPQINEPFVLFNPTFESVDGGQALKAYGSTVVIQPSAIDSEVDITQLQLTFDGFYNGVSEFSIPAHQLFAISYDFNIVASPGVTTTVSLGATFNSLPGSPGFNLNLGTGTGNRSFMGSLVQDVIGSNVPTAAVGIPFKIQLTIQTLFDTQSDSIQVVIPNNSIDFGNFVPVPEPSTWALLSGLAVLGVAFVRRRR